MDIYGKVSAFCAPIIADKNRIFTAASLTTEFIDSQLGREWPLVPDDMKQALFVGVQQIVRPIARRSGSEELNIQQLHIDLPEEQLLQDRYSVPGERDAEGNITFSYVPRHLLTEGDVRAICDRDRKLSRLYARRADALESWFYRSRESAA